MKNYLMFEIPYQSDIISTIGGLHSVFLGYIRAVVMSGIPRPSGLYM